MFKRSTEEFVEKATKKNGDKYDYSKVEYVGSITKVCIICPIHGDFWQCPNSHLQGAGCPKCGGVYHRTTADFIEQAKTVHSVKYNYSKVKYVNQMTKVCIVCPEHGDFWQIPRNHYRGNNCPDCATHHFRKLKPQQEPTLFEVL
jgi:hypothetical protein